MLNVLPSLSEPVSAVFGWQKFVAAEWQDEALCCAGAAAGAAAAAASAVVHDHRVVHLKQGGGINKLIIT